MSKLTAGVTLLLCAFDVAAAQPVGARSVNGGSSDLAETMRSDIRALQGALARYHDAHGKYPRSVGFDGLFTKYGAASEDWIAGLAPEFIPRLPRDPRRTENPVEQYLYRSDGRDYKLIAHRPVSCAAFREAHREMVDPRRDCWAIGVWTPGGREW